MDNENFFDIQFKKIQPEQLPILENLYQLYRYDLSEFNEQDIQENGLFPHDELIQYVEDSKYLSQFILVDQALAGFILINMKSHESKGEMVKNLDDFFILGRFRRKGIGKESATKLFKNYPGYWQVNKKTYNRPAMLFWRKVICEFSKGDFFEQIVMEDIHIHIFKSKNQSANPDII